MKLKLVRSEFWASSHPVEAHEYVKDGKLYRVSQPFFHEWYGESGNQVDVYEIEKEDEKVITATVHCSCGKSWVETFTQEQWDFRYVDEEGKILVTCEKCQDDIQGWHQSEMLELELCEALAQIPDENKH